MRLPSVFDVSLMKLAQLLTSPQRGDSMARTVIHAERELVADFPTLIVDAVDEKVNKTETAITAAIAGVNSHVDISIAQASTDITVAIAGVNSHVDTSIAQAKSEITTTINGLNGKLDSVSGSLDYQLQVLNKICGETDKKVIDLREPISKIGDLDKKISYALHEIEEIEKLSWRIFNYLEIKDISGRDFDAVRKCLQLLNRLEDWVLADSFKGAEYNEDEVNRLKGEFSNHPQYSQLESLLNEVLGEPFPRTKNMETRAKYYVKILNVRIKILSLVASTSPAAKQQ